MELIKNNRFLEDFKKYQEIISNVNDDSLKNELTILLNSLANEVRKIDSMHSELFHRSGVTPNIQESRNNIVSIRKKLEQKISDCNRAGIIKK
jgi:hypothetical protein